MGIIVCPCSNATVCAPCWHKLEAELRQCKRELEEIRVALNGYKDSNLASLAETIRCRNEFLEQEILKLKERQDY